MSCALSITGSRGRQMVEKAFTIVNKQQKRQTNMCIQQWLSVSNKSLTNAPFIACLLVVTLNCLRCYWDNVTSLWLFLMPYRSDKQCLFMCVAMTCYLFNTHLFFSLWWQRNLKNERIDKFITAKGSSGYTDNIHYVEIFLHVIYFKFFDGLNDFPFHRQGTECLFPVL